jgi:hypothetical protein
MKSALWRQQPSRAGRSEDVDCHPEAAEFSAKRGTANEGPLHFDPGAGLAINFIDPQARKAPRPKDDKIIVKTGMRNPTRNPSPLSLD